jgi:two-component system response regulator
MTKRPILLVEDNMDDEILTLRAFKKHNIMNEVVTARDGEEALDYLFATGPYSGQDLSVQPQVVLLDLALPRMGGLEVLRRLRGDARTKLLPVVVLTSSKEEEDTIRSYALGANGYVRKPIHFAEFDQAVKTLGLYWLHLNEVAPSGQSGGAVLVPRPSGTVLVADMPCGATVAIESSGERDLSTEHAALIAAVDAHKAHCVRCRLSPPRVGGIEITRRPQNPE